jgi:N-acetylmuramoyl-L-alanine amidase
MSLVILDGGHGGTDSGAVGQGFLEKERALTLTKLVEKELVSQGIRVKLTRSADVFVTLSDRAKMANKEGATLFVSFHLNSGGGTGYESFTHTSRSKGSVKLQNLLHDNAMEVLKPLGFKDRGKKNANYAVLRETKMPAVLTENGFIDNAKDMSEIGKDAVLGKLAVAYAKAILSYLGVAYKESKQPEPSDSNLNYVQIGAFKDKKNAQELAEKAKKAGFNVTIK